MNIQADLPVSLNDDNGSYNFVLKDQTILSIDTQEIDLESANKIYDAIVSAISMTLSTVSEKTHGNISFSGGE